jgi:hypothetical protein
MQAVRFAILYVRNCHEKFSVVGEDELRYGEGTEI